MLPRSGLFLFVMLISVASASILSHSLVGLLRIKAEPVFVRQFGTRDRQDSRFVHGSSLAFDGLDWNRIAREFDFQLHNWSSLGSSPCEWEVLQQRTPAANSGFVVVSMYDLNEYWLSDFRADIVPIGRALADLRASPADWAETKRVLSQYPMAALRRLFPTAGRSDGVMVGIRAKIQHSFASVKANGITASGATATGTRPELSESITDWDPARFQRRLSGLRSTIRGKNGFDGAKRHALMRLLQSTSAKGYVCVIVLPVSQSYHAHLLTEADRRSFEELLAFIAKEAPNVPVVRIDRSPSLLTDSLYYDLVHLNAAGQSIATELLMGFLRSRRAAMSSSPMEPFITFGK